MAIGWSVFPRRQSFSQGWWQILPQPPEKENKALTWPDWPLKMRTSSSQEEGCERDFAVDAKWPEYRDYADALFFAVDSDFPRALLPDDTGKPVKTPVT